MISGWIAAVLSQLGMGGTLFVPPVAGLARPAAWAADEAGANVYGWAADPAGDNAVGWLAGE